jgi:hypothetical protein
VSGAEADSTSISTPTPVAAVARLTSPSRSRPGSTTASPHTLRACRWCHGGPPAAVSGTSPTAHRRTPVPGAHANNAAQLTRIQSDARAAAHGASSTNSGRLVADDDAIPGHRHDLRRPPADQRSQCVSGRADLAAQTRLRRITTAAWAPARVDDLERAGGSRSACRGSRPPVTSGAARSRTYDYFAEPGSLDVRGDARMLPRVSARRYAGGWYARIVPNTLERTSPTDSSALTAFALGTALAGMQV